MILDNLKSHKGKRARYAVREKGAHLLLLPLTAQTSIRSYASGEDRARVIFGSGGLINVPDGGAPIPWQEFVEPLDGMLGDAVQNVGEPGLRIDVVHLRLGYLARGWHHYWTVA